MGMAVLKLSFSQQEANTAFSFLDSSVNLYTLEELLYYMSNNFANVLEEFTGERLQKWLAEELNLHQEADMLKRFSRQDKSVASNFILFLSYFDYLEQNALAALELKVQKWEERARWEKLKEKGDKHLRAGEYEKAERLYQQALVYIDAPNIYNNLGIAFMHIEKYMDAEVAFHEALLRDNTQIGIIFNVIELYLLQNRYTLAEKMLESAKVLEPENKMITHYVAELEWMRGNAEDTKTRFMEAIEHGGQAESYYRLADVYVEEGLLEEAVELLQGMPDAYKRSGRHAYKLAQVYDSQERVWEAKECMAAGMAADESDPRMLAYYSRLCRLAGLHDEALEVIERAYRIAGTRDFVKLELAHNKKIAGKHMEYERLLLDVLKDWKYKYKRRN